MKTIMLFLILHIAALCFGQNQGDTVFLMAEICIREMPESLAIDQETSRENGLEYSWDAYMLSNDGRCFYSISANHFKPPLAKVAKIPIDRAALVLMTDVVQRNEEEGISYDLNAIASPYRLHSLDSCFLLKIPVSAEILDKIEEYSIVRVFFSAMAFISGKENQDVTDTTNIGEWIKDPAEPQINGIADIMKARLRIIDGD